MISPVSVSDPSSTAFDSLAEPIRRWIWRKGWTALRDIQERAIPCLIDGEDDVVIAAATAGGKTEAAFFPLISKALATTKGNGFDLVYVGPLRALINDQFQRLADLCESLEFPVTPWHGDISQGVKLRAAKNPRGILLITPESLEAQFVRHGMSIPRLFAGTQAVVIDELHALLDSERGIHLRSLLTRMELALGRRVRRVGLSATLGDMALVNAYLRPESPDRVVQLVSHSDGQELRVQLRGYIAQGDDELSESQTAQPKQAEEEKVSAVRAAGKHLFDNLRGTDNLVFANSRQRVEVFSDLLRTMCEKRSIPNEFFPHHGSLSREHREYVEIRLKGGLPVTAISTSTLELGIDIGEVECIGQIGAPWSVASLRQRLGRSGRRPGQPAILRMYAIEARTDADSHPADRMHLQLVRSVAMIELLIEGWCEPPKKEMLHLSTFTHQILSVIAERNGASVSRIHTVLCERGPFRSVDQSLFKRLLRRLGDPEVALIEQAPDGTLLLGENGERLVEHYSFYAVFQTPQEFSVEFKGKTLGKIPSHVPLVKDLTIILAGKRWRIEEVDDKNKVIQVAPDHAGKPPIFGGDPGEVHQKVVERMREVLCADAIPVYLDETAAKILSSARAAYRRFGLEEQPIKILGEGRYLLAPWTGTIGTVSLAMVLASLGYSVTPFDGILEVHCVDPECKDLVLQLEEIAMGKLDLLNLIQMHSEVPETEKFHRYLDKDLLLADVLSAKVELESVPMIAQRLCERLDLNASSDLSLRRQPI